MSKHQTETDSAFENWKANILSITPSSQESYMMTLAWDAAIEASLNTSDEQINDININVNAKRGMSKLKYHIGKLFTE